VTDASGRNFGLHPSCERLAEMFNSTGNYAGKKRHSALAHIRTISDPVTNKSEYINATKRLPKALFSHRDQIEQWQASVPQGIDVLSGWGGRAAEVLHSTFNTEQTGGFYMPMNFWFSGNSPFQTGVSEGQFVITANGALNLTSPAAGNSSATGVLAKRTRPSPAFSARPWLITIGILCSSPLVTSRAIASSAA
jgi:uncharacterized protein (DUF1501 family)